jgi:hypothetical protein
MGSSISYKIGRQTSDPIQPHAGRSIYIITKVVPTTEPVRQQLSVEAQFKQKITNHAKLELVFGDPHAQ